MKQNVSSTNISNGLPYKTCEHIKDDGVTCGSPAKHDARFCHFHTRLHDNKVAPSDPAYDFPILETEQSIQIAIMQMMRGVLKGRITERKAAIMLSGIKAAAALLRQCHGPQDKTMNKIVPDLQTYDTNCKPA